ncbi:hypothetical protein GRI97_16500 [Altererythrobacter xixiisoli]|uniref:Uncharacterized protein n=1 Tax=Croceibacterium xixiisoli TaxID=1476466 RepID=A0A6I4TZT8_9SPHN|nr:hypothetical protein [Croceibacterium xixiisoli]MXP00592.1 hypothetical protein [Croceibacterium xixiisoli]
MADLIDRFRTQAHAILDRYVAAHTPDNFERLQAAFAEHGWALTGSMGNLVSFTLHDPWGGEMPGLALASVEHLLPQIAPGCDVSDLSHPLASRDAAGGQRRNLFEIGQSSVRKASAPWLSTI